MDSGGVAEWPIAAVLKTVVPKGTVGSNPTSSGFVKLKFCEGVAAVLPAFGGSAAGGKTVVPKGVGGSQP